MGNAFRTPLADGDTPYLFSRISLKLNDIVTDNPFVQGYEWVGWRNDTPNMLGRPVEITFEFDYSRNFTAIHLHMNNYFTKDVQVSPFVPLPVLFRKLRAPGTTVNFNDHTFGDASALLSGFKNISPRFTARWFLLLRHRLLSGLVLSVWQSFIAEASAELFLSARFISLKRSTRTHSVCSRCIYNSNSYI